MKLSLEGIFFAIILHASRLVAWNFHRNPLRSDIFQRTINGERFIMQSKPVVPKKALNSLLAILISCSLTTQANAQIPTMDEYYAGSGSVVRKSSTSNQNVQGNTPLYTTNDQALQLVKKLPKLVQELNQYLAKKDWDRIVALANNADSALKKKYYGTESNFDLASTLDITNPEAREIESFREELLFELDQLKDIAVSNRVYFFNSEDLQQIEIISSENKQNQVEENNSIEEGKQHLAELENYCTKIVNIVLHQK